MPKIFYYSFSSYKSAQQAKKRCERRGETVGAPWYENGTWHLSVVVWGGAA
jgi:hypothetical protein